jgi:7-cyano-7-deazaguanine synthase in queuosine biosynthesis
MGIPEYRIEFGGAIASSGRFDISSNVEPAIRRVFYELDDDVIASIAFGHVPDRVLDLYEVLQGLRTIDRYAPRTWNGDTRPKEQRGPRLLLVLFQVRDVEFWHSRAGALLAELVWYLSGDQLVASFEPMCERTRVFEAQERLPIESRTQLDAVTLLSGGIDSVFGVISCVGDRHANRILAISVDTNNRHIGLQSKIVQALRMRRPYGAWELPIVHLPLRTHLTPDRSSRESSYRMRVLGFLAAGILAAIGIGLDRLVVAENGPGALNLPSSVVLGGAQLNRALHPTTLRLVAELVSLSLGRTLKIENIGLSLTKRQMVNSLSDAGFRSLLDVTNSCDRFPYKDAKRHCGVCSSCLLRAIATLDQSLLFDQLGADAVSFSRRLATMSRSAAFAHLSLLGARLDEVFASKAPLERLWSIDPNVKDAYHTLAPGDVLNMLRSFRSDISDLESVVDTVLSGRATGAAQTLALLHRSS